MLEERKKWKTVSKKFKAPGSFLVPKDDTMTGTLTVSLFFSDILSEFKKPRTEEQENPVRT
jgi:hypothetical protein